jgi:hypothetical protein
MVYALFFFYLLSNFSFPLIIMVDNFGSVLFSCSSLGSFDWRTQPWLYCCPSQGVTCTFFTFTFTCTCTCTCTSTRTSSHICVSVFILLLVPVLVPILIPAIAPLHVLSSVLQDKMGDRSNASSEVAYDNAYGEMLGVEGRGVATIVEMVQHTRFISRPNSDLHLLTF